MISLEDLITPVTSDEQLEAFLSSLETLKIPARSWRAAGTYRTILRVVASAYAGFSNVAVAFVKSGFLETAEKAWLTLLARYVYGVERITAAFATGSVTLANTGGGIYTLNPGELRVLNAITGKAYTNTASFTSSPATSISVAVRAVEIGTASNAAPGSVTRFETTLAGVTATNPSAIVGSDDELDPDLRDRCKNRLAILGGKGPRGAYAYAAASATRPDGSAVAINRRRISAGSSNGTVTVWVAAPSGMPDPLDVQYVADAVDAIARPDSVTANVVAANPVSVSRSLTVWARLQDGLSASDLAVTVQSALIAMAAAYPIGGIAKPPSPQGYLFASNIEGTARAAHPAIFAVDGAGSDVTLADGDVVQWSSTVAVRIVEVST